MTASPILIPNGPVYITDGGSLNLTCEIDQDVAAVTWIRNDVSIMQITNTTVCSFGNLSSLDTYNYSVTCDQQKRFSMVKYRVNSSDDNTTWCCQMYSLNYTDLGTSLMVIVLMHVPVCSVKLLNGTTLTLIENQSAVFVCETNECRPSAAIYWMMDGINITGYPNNVTEISVGSDLFVSRGILTYTGQRVDNRKSLTCGAYNGPDSVQMSGNLTIIIYYPPSIQGLASLYKVIEYQRLNVTCQVSSNPSPDWIFWTPTGEGSEPSRLYFSTVSRNNSGTYSCTAQNTMTPTDGIQQNGTNTSQMQVDVLYAAKITKFVAKGNISEMLENSSIVLYCHVESNPYSVISLYFGDVLISTIQDSHELMHNATVGCLDSGKYICSATNSVMNGVTASAEIHLTVQCE
ncbi:hypothetical protein CHS0354_039082 [Potamilus streckersoni]|uniref:Ig-like domain-containing protein n=1 Tax=Potamilus streckersoni TaxID=2493646 RepID=A0AAE0SY78_9BIVA|nr:hypothetical protein CHS0354_039082 [Potamilus streckersoni]